MNKLEKVLEHLINDDQEQAEALLHEFIVEQAKRIHRDIISEAEGEDEFLDADSLGDDEAVDDLSASLTGDDEGEGEGEAEGEADSEEDDLEDRIEDMEGTVADLESQLAELSAAFDELNAIEAEEHEGEEVKESDDSDEDDFSDEDFADLEESLKPVAFDGKVAKEAGAGKPVNGKSVSPVASRKTEARPVQVKGDQHKGFDREDAPAVKKGAMKADNTVDSSKDVLKPVSRDGDKSALLNSKKGFGAETSPSPISGRK